MRLLRLRGEDWSAAVLWLFYATLGVLAGVIVSLLVLLAMREDITLGGFTDGGQFALYSAGMWGTMYYVTVKPARRRMRFTEWFVLAGCFGIMVSAVLFALAMVYSSGRNIDPDVVRLPSIVIFAVSVATTTLAVAVDNHRSAPDLPGRRQADQRALDESFDRT